MIRAAINKPTARRTAPAVARSIVPTLPVDDGGSHSGELPGETAGAAAGDAPRSAKDIAAAYAGRTPLTEEERRKLNESEKAIYRRALAWLEVGEALVTIRENRLYRETHNSFEAYACDRCRLERSYVYWLMRATKRFPLVMSIADKLRIRFTAETQMLALSKCPDADLPDVLQWLATQIEPNDQGDRIPTIKLVAKAIQQVTGKVAVGGRARRRSTRPILPARNGGKRTLLASADPAATVRAMLKDARAIVYELTKRTPIKQSDAPAKAADELEFNRDANGVIKFF